MNKTNFISYLNNPTLLSVNTEKELKDLCASFPYFQTGQALYLKSLHQSESIHFDEQLKIAAVHTPRRAALYYLLNQKDIVEVPVETTEVQQKATPKKAIKKDKLETEILYSAINASITQEVISELENLPEIGTPQEIEIKEFTKKPLQQSKTKQSFTDWLHNAKAPTKVEEDAPKIEEETTEEAESNKSQFFSPVKMAKKSLIDKNDFVSETLANIYYAQANYAKALDAYEKLSLKFPEKKTYFASQIEIIKNKIKNL